MAKHKRLTNKEKQERVGWKKQRLFYMGVLSYQCHLIHARAEGREKPEGFS